MLMAFYLLAKRSWLVIPLAGFLGGLHRPTFLIFGLAMAVHFLFNKEKKYHLIAGVGILALAFSLYIHNPQAIFQFLPLDLQGLVKIFGPGAGAGTFFDFNFYRQIITFYLPFALLGLIYLLKTRQLNYLFFYFVLNFIIVYFNFIFHKRFIIHLDIIIIILAGVGVKFFVSKFLSNKIGKVGILIFLLGALYVFGASVKNIKPLISNQELEEIRSLAQITEQEAFVMAISSYYSPWIYGYSQRRTIAPGLFEYNKWDLMTWQTFWTTDNLELRHQLLDQYERPVYVFIGDRVGQMDFSNDLSFVKISKRIWKYGAEKQ